MFTVAIMISIIRGKITFPVFLMVGACEELRVAIL